MDNFIVFCEKILHVLHCVTGWFIHPKEGGCCSSEIKKLDKTNEKE